VRRAGKAWGSIRFDFVDRSGGRQRTDRRQEVEFAVCSQRKHATGAATGIEGVDKPAISTDRGVDVGASCSVRCQGEQSRDGPQRIGASSAAGRSAISDPDCRLSLGNSVY